MAKTQTEAVRDLIWKVKPKTGRAAFKAQVESYFTNCDLTGEKPTIAGMCLHVGFKSVNHMQEYGKERNGVYADIIDWAILQVEKRYEEDLMSGRNVVGAIFALKRLGWEDSVLNKLSDLKNEGDKAKEDKTIKVEIVK
jgi:hypothetical protein